jgi:hypothetical protein
MVEKAFVQFLRAAVYEDLRCLYYWHDRCEEQGWDRYFEFLENVLQQALHRRFGRHKDPAPIRQFAQHMKAFTDNPGPPVELEVIEFVLLTAHGLPLKPTGDQDAWAKVIELAAVRLLLEENLSHQTLTAILANADVFVNMRELLSHVERNGQSADASTVSPPRRHSRFSATRQPPRDLGLPDPGGRAQAADEGEAATATATASKPDRQNHIAAARWLLLAAWVLVVAALLVAGLLGLATP